MLTVSASKGFRKVASPVNAIFSDEDADLREIAWKKGGSTGYAVANRLIGGKSTAIYAHRIVVQRMLGRELGKNEVVDHINHNIKDNRRSNLRAVTRMQNQQNRLKGKDNTSGHLNVFKRGNKWLVQVKSNGIIHYGGMHFTIDAAIERAAALRKSLGFLGA